MNYFLTFTFELYFSVVLIFFLSFFEDKRHIDFATTLWSRKQDFTDKIVLTLVEHK